MDNFKVFISSTRLDLAAHRQELRNKLTGLQQVVLGMEDMGSNPADAVTVSEEYVRECDVFIGVYAFRYGYTPEEPGASVTEQEYELARELGKRCLCYVADESLRPAAAEEEQWKLDRLSQFKQRVDRELVRSLFTTPDDLREKVSDDVNKLLRGSPLGYVLRDVQRRWRENEKKERSYLLGVLQEPPLTVPSPLEPVWGGFLALRGWHERIAADLNGLRVKIEVLREEGVETPELTGLALRAGEIDTGQDYASLAESVEALLTQEARDSLFQVIERLKKERKEEPSFHSPRARHLSRLIDTAYDVFGAVRSLTQKVETRHYSRILPVMGGVGSGKTHFLASLMDEGRAATHGSADFLLLPLDRPAPGQKIEDLILEGVRARTGMRWRSLREFDAFLEDPAPHLKGFVPAQKTRLVVAADDFQKWLAKDGADEPLEALTKFVTGNTQLHSLHWLVLLRDISYGEVADQEKRDRKYWWFWEQFSHATDEAQASARVGVWLVLDQLNREEQTGLKLIHRNLESRPGERAVILGRTEQSEHASQEFSSPFIACIVIDLLEQLPAASIVDLNFIEFVRQFWEKHVARLDTARLGDDPRRAGRMLDLAVRLFARSLLKSDMRPYLSDALDEITQGAAELRSELKDRARAESALGILLAGNLLKMEYQEDVEKLSVQFETFWEWSLARAVEPADGEGGLTDLLARLQAVSSPQVREGALIFLLLLLDQRAGEGGADPQALRPLMLDALRSGQMPPSAIWFAGPKCSLVLQQALAEDARERPHTFAGAQEMFAFLYFIGDCRPDVLDAPARLRLLQPHFEAVGEYNLVEYYLYVAERLFYSSDDEKIMEAMACLEGCEVLGVTQSLAEAALYNTSGEEGETMHFVLTYLKKNLESIRAEYGLRQKPEDQRRYFFWEWVVCVFCRYAVRERGLGAYRMLLEAGWYDPEPEGLDDPVPLRLRQEANLALGYWYRRDARRAGKKEYQELVNRLAEHPGLIERETAFFFIRHTESYEKDKSVRVSDVFRPALEKLFLDPDMSDLVDEYVETFQENLENFDELDSRRLRNRPDGTGPHAPPA